jgi:hypothetical protein
VVGVVFVEEYIKLEFGFGLSHLNFNVPVAASSPNTYNNIATITVIKINGMNTRTHDMTVIPPWQSAFKRKVIVTMTINLKNAVLYSPLNVSITIWVNENAK